MDQPQPKKIVPLLAWMRISSFCRVWRRRRPQMVRFLCWICCGQTLWWSLCRSSFCFTSVGTEVSACSCWWCSPCTLCKVSAWHLATCFGIWLSGGYFGTNDQGTLESSRAMKTNIPGASKNQPPASNHIYLTPQPQLQCCDRKCQASSTEMVLFFFWRRPNTKYKQ